MDRRRRTVYKIDYEHWGRMDGWTPTEFAALCAEIDPSDIDTKEFREFRESAKAVRFEKIKQLAERALKTGGTKDPADWLDWATRKRITIPAGLRDSVKPKQSQSEPGPRETTTLLKLIYGMALAKYGYVPGVRGHAVQEIHDDLARHGLDLSQDTILKKLRLAVDELGTNPGN